MTSLVKAKAKTVVSKQLPEFVREENQQFVKFIQAYYEWLEQDTQAGGRIRNIESSIDIDNTVDEFVKYFKNELMVDLPEYVLSDKRFLAKQINDLYRAKGTKQSYEMLFRILYNEEAEIYYPKVDVLRTSDGKYDKRTVIKVIEHEGDAFNLVGQTITQPATDTNGLATARVESVIKFSVGENIIAEININKEHIVGTFVPQATIVGLDNQDGTEIIMTSQTMITNVKLDTQGSYYNIGQKFSTDAGSGLGFACEVATVKKGSLDGIYVAAPGTGYTVGQELLFNNTDTGGYGARAVITELDQSAIILEGVDGAVYSSTNVTFDLGDPTPLTPDVGLGRLSDTAIIVPDVSYLLFEDGSKIVPEDSAVGGIKTIKLLEAGANYNKTPLVTAPEIPGSGAKLLAYGTQIGRITSINITDLGVYYEAKPTVASPVNAIIDYLGSTTFAVGEAIFSEAEVFRTEQGGVLLLEDGTQTLTEEQNNGYGVYNSYDSARSLLTMSPSNVKTRITAEDGSGHILYETGMNQVTENSGEFTANQTIQGLVSGARARVVSMGHAEVTPQIGAVGSYVGQFIGADGKISESSKKMADNLFYQDFSYVIKVGQSVDKYRDAVKKLLHPVGLAMFGEVRVQSQGDAKMPSASSRLTQMFAILQTIIDAKMKSFHRDTVLVLPRFVEANMRMHVMASEFLPVLYLPQNEPLSVYVLDMRSTATEQWTTHLWLDPQNVRASLNAREIRIESKVLRSNVKVVGGQRLGHLEKYKFFIPPYEAGTKNSANLNRDAWNQPYPAPNNGHWDLYGNTQIKDFGGITLYDVINNPETKVNFNLWEAHIDVVQFPPGSVTFDNALTYVTMDDDGLRFDKDTELLDATDIYFDDNVTTMDSIY